MFSKAQEADLGDVVAEQMNRSLQVYPQADLTAPLDRIAARLAPFLPGSDYQFRFSLIELARANAFAIPGGRIFVSRKMVEFVRNEDELAGVLAHEMGHVVARQASVDITRSFNEVLKVASAGDRQDIFLKFNRLLDAPPRKSANHTDDDQVVADKASLEAVWRAGYDPQAFPESLDRLTQNNGATGNFFTDLFGATRPESKRLRELLKEIDAIPAACRQARPPQDDTAFRSWQKQVSELSPEDLIPSPAGRKPVLTLRPRLQPELTYIRFSPDGQFLIAQDETGIDVLRREPLGLLFRIPARGAGAALWSADSQRVIFVTSGTRVETWNILTKSRERRWEPDDSLGCEGLVASPDARTAVCIITSGTRSMRLLDMDTGMELVRHEPLPIGPFRMIFSPDGTTFLAGAARGDLGAWAFNTKTRSEISIKNPLMGALFRNPQLFAFLQPDRLAVFNTTTPKDSGVFSWPEGKRILNAEVPAELFTAATKGGVLLIRPKGYAVAAVNLEQHRVFQVSRNPAMDFYDAFEAAERKTGEIAIYSGGKTTASEALQLPEAELGNPRSAQSSPDLEYLAVSIQNRGFLWDLKTGQSQQVPPFTAGRFSDDGVWTATLEQTEPGPPGEGDRKYLTRESIDLRRGAVLSQARLAEPAKNEQVLRRGRYELTIQRGAPPSTKASFQIAADARNLWSEQMEGQWLVTLNDAVIFDYPAKNKASEQLVKDLPSLKPRVEAAQKEGNAEVLDVRDVETGKRIGGAVVEGGTGLNITRVLVAGRTLFVLEPGSNRTLAYSLETGERLGEKFGLAITTNSTRSLVAINNQVGRINVYDSSMKPLADFAYPGVVLHADFDSQGKRLLVLTSKQEVFVDNLP